MKINSTKLFRILFYSFLFCVVLIIYYINIETKYVREVGSNTIDTSYLNTSLPTEQRISNLMSQMTIDEKIGQMALIEKNSISNLKDVSDYGLGAILSGGGAKPEANTSNGWLQMVKSFTDESRKSRLQIPILYGIDAIHGHSNVPNATIFPHSIGIGAANDATLTQKIAAATAEEVKATGISWVYSPNLDAPEDIRWGRTYEGFSSDSKINSKLGAAYVKGTQDFISSSTSRITTLESTSSQHINMVGTAKHFLGAGGMLWNSSTNAKYKIDQGKTVVSDKTLRDFYLPPFKSVIDAGVMSVMAGLNTLNNTKIAANSYVLNDVLKKELDFKGFVVSDWYGVYFLSDSKYNDAVTAINAGVDMVMLPYDYRTFVINVKNAVKKGNITQDRINDAVRRILRAKFSAGLFDGQQTLPNLNVIGSASHRAIAREAVSKSLVLLQNNNVLPLLNLHNPGDVNQTILVAGSAADNTGRQSGAWTIEWQGVDGNNVPGATSILKGIQNEVEAVKNYRVVFDTNGNFNSKLNENEINQKANVGIIVVGEKPYAEGWGDNENPTLSDEDLQTISNVQKVSKKIIVIIISGRPLILPPQFKTWDGIIAAWLPGSEGEGIADVLFGKTPFVGKLPLPWPTNLKQLPFSVDENSADGTTPLFNQGFGL